MAEGTKQMLECGRTHKGADCTLRKPCPECNGQHLGVLHDVNRTQIPSRVLCMNPQSMSPKVLLKAVKLRLFNKTETFDTYAILDDGSEQMMLLPGDAKYLDLEGEPEQLELRTVRQQTETLNRRTINLKISAASFPERRFSIDGVFASDGIMFGEQSYPADRLKQRYPHLHGIPLSSFSNVQPHILIGSDNPFLITPVEQIQYGTKGALAAVKTRLEWALQGPTSLGESSDSVQCLITSQTNPYTELKRHVELLWQTNTFPFRNEKLITRSKQDKEAMDLLNAHTIRVTVDETKRYATPLLRKKPASMLSVPAESVMPLLHQSERKLEKIYAVQKHVQDHCEGNEDVVETVLESFYVDNCLKSLTCPNEAKTLLLKIRDLLSTGGFDMRQWASNIPLVVDHLPSDARLDSAKFWLNQN